MSAARLVWEARASTSRWCCANQPRCQPGFASNSEKGRMAEAVAHIQRALELSHANISSKSSVSRAASENKDARFSNRIFSSG
jgi:hypothetical protein